MKKTISCYLMIALLLQYVVWVRQSIAADLTMNANATWASAGGQDSTNVANANSGDNVAISASRQLTITTQGNPDDGGGVGTYTLGDVTGTGSMVGGNAGGGVLSVTINSVDLTGTVELRNTDVANANAGYTITNNLESDGQLRVLNTETGTDNVTVTTTANGDVVVDTLLIQGNTRTGSDASLTINGATATVTSGATLDDSTGVATLTFSGTTQAVTGTIDGDSAGEGAVEVNGADVTFNNNIGGTRLLSFTVNSGKKAQLAAGTLGATTITNSGTTELDTSVTMTGTTLELNGSGTDNSGIIAMGTNSYTGNTVIDATAVTNVNATNVVQVNPHSNFSSGTITLINGPGTGAGSADTVAKFSTNSSNLLTSYSISIANTDDVAVTATRKSTKTIADTIGSTESAADALAIGFDSTQGDSAANSAYQSVLASGGAAAKSAAEQSQPDPNLAPVRIMTHTIGQITKLVGLHLASSRSSIQNSGQGLTGISTGDRVAENGIWFRPFTTLGEQDKRSGIAGYDFWSTGFVTGIDRLFTDRFRAGVDLGFSYSSVDGKESADHDSETFGYSLGLYGDYSWDKFFVELMTSYTYNKVDADRKINFGNLNRIASSDYYSHQFTTRGDIGYGISLNKNSEIVPALGFLFDNVSPDSYTEEGAGSLNLTVDPDSQTAAIGILSLKYKNKKEFAMANLLTKLKSSVFYDFASDESRSTANFSGSSASFRTEGSDVAELGASFGAGIAYSFKDERVTLSADYDFEFKEDYHANIVKFEIRFEF